MRGIIISSISLSSYQFFPVVYRPPYIDIFTSSFLSSYILIQQMVLYGAATCGSSWKLWWRENDST